MIEEYDIDYKSASNVKDKATIKKVDQMRISHMDKNRVKKIEYRSNMA